MAINVTALAHISQRCRKRQKKTMRGKSKHMRTIERERKYDELNYERQGGGGDKFDLLLVTIEDGLGFLVGCHTICRYAGNWISVAASYRWNLFSYWKRIGASQYSLFLRFSKSAMHTISIYIDMGHMKFLQTQRSELSLSVIIPSNAFQYITLIYIFFFICILCVLLRLEIMTQI